MFPLSAPRSDEESLLLVDSRGSVLGLACVCAVVEVESGVVVEAEPRVGVETEPRVGVEAEPRVGIETEPRVGVEAESGVGVETEPRMAVGVDSGREKRGLVKVAGRADEAETDSVLERRLCT